MHFDTAATPQKPSFCQGKPVSIFRVKLQKLNLKLSVSLDAVDTVNST